MSRLIAVCLSLALLFAPVRVGAEELSEELIVMRDGTVLRGHAAEVHPGQSVVLVLPTGETRTLQWSDIDEAHGPSFEAATGPLLTHPGDGRVPVNIESVGVPLRIGIQESPVALTRHAPTGPYQALCMTPCRLYLTPGYHPLTVDGEHVEKHLVDLSIPPAGGSFGLRSPRISFAAFMMIPATIIAAIGGAALIGGGFSGGVDKAGNPLPNPDVPSVAGGGVLLGVGIGGVIAGAILASKSRRGVAWQR